MVVPQTHDALAGFIPTHDVTPDRHLCLYDCLHADDDCWESEPKSRVMFTQLEQTQTFYLLLHCSLGVAARSHCKRLSVAIGLYCCGDTVSRKLDAGQPLCISLGGVFGALEACASASMAAINASGGGDVALFDPAVNDSGNFLFNDIRKCKDLKIVSSCDASYVNFKNVNLRVVGWDMPGRCCQLLLLRHQLRQSSPGSAPIL